MENVQENFTAILSKLGDDLKKTSLDSIGLGVLKLNYEANAKRIYEYAESWPETYRKAITTVDTMYSAMSHMRNNGYSTTKMATLIDSLDLLLFILLGDEVDRDIKIKEYAPSLQRFNSPGTSTGVLQRSSNQSSNAPDYKKAFRYVYNRLNNLSTYNIQSGMYTNYKSSVNSDPLFELAWKNVIDNRSNSQDLYDLLRTFILFLKYERSDLDNLMGSPSSVKAYIDSLNSPTMLVSAISQLSMLDPAHPTSIIAQFDPNVAFSSNNLRNTLIMALRGQYSSVEGLVWNTTVQDNVKIMAWMINIVYNLIGSNTIAEFLR